MGEKEQVSWWASSFFSNSGERFLSPIFPKTASFARINGACRAAQVVHDEYIGKGDVYHLFRLPENLERTILEVLINDASVLDCIASEESARAGLRTLAEGGLIQDVGPILLEGKIDLTMVGLMAGAYSNALQTGEQVFPYFRGHA